MIPGAILGGRIFDEKGQLMSNAIVQAFTVAYAFGRATLAPLVSKVTDDRGEFRLFWVPPGEYYLAVTPAPVAPVVRSAPAARTARPTVAATAPARRAPVSPPKRAVVPAASAPSALSKMWVDPFAE